MSPVAVVPLILCSIIAARTDADVPCQSHECSDDAAVPAVYGNEWMRWGPVPETTRYEVGVGEPIPELCAQTLRPKWSPYLDSGCWPPEGVRYCYYTRACNSLECSDWSATCVEFEGAPYACFRTGCEEPCYPGAPDRFPEIPQCEVTP